MDCMSVQQLSEKNAAAQYKLSACFKFKVVAPL
jgi:hypothetical protein